MSESNEELLQHFRDKAIMAESKIKLKVNEALENPEIAARRWFWELLQNAKDSVAYNPLKEEVQYRNEKERKVDVILTYFKKDDNHFLSFEHNGLPFRDTENPYRFDDITNLVLPVSGKDETEKITTGKFGTGFLSTHILSMKIEIDGVFLKKDGVLQDFVVQIDRTQIDQREVFIESIVKALSSSVNYTDHVKPLNSKFTYHLEHNYKKDIKGVKDIISRGFQDIDLILPLVLCFNPTINSVVIDNQLEVKKSVFKLAKPIDKDEVIQMVRVEKNENEIDIVIAIENDVQLAAFINQEITPPELINFRKEYKDILGADPASLFSSFPLLGSEVFSFPVIINSNSFLPVEKRDNMSLRSAENGNQGVIEKAVKLYKKLLNYIGEEKWGKAYYAADTSSDIPANITWIDNNWHKTSVISDLRESILTAPIVDTPLKKDEKETGRKAINSDQQTLYFPINANRETLWKYAFDLFPGLLPRLGELTEWNDILWESEKDFKKVNPEFIVKSISGFGNLESLSEFLYPDEERKEESTLAWLYQFIKFIKVDLNRTELLNLKDTKDTRLSYPIVPNRYGNFKLINDLSYDEGSEGGIIEEFTIGLYHLFFQDNILAGLLHQHFKELELVPVARIIKETELAFKIIDAVNVKLKQEPIPNSDKSALMELRNELSLILDFPATDDKEEKRKVKYKRLFDGLSLNKITIAILEKEKLNILTRLSDLDRRKKIDLKTIEAIAERPDIIKIAEQLLSQQIADNHQFESNKQKGDIFEAIFKNVVLEYNYLSIRKVEGENDFVIENLKTGKSFYIEIKSTALTGPFVELTPEQGKAFGTKHNYVLCIVPGSNEIHDEISFKEKAIFNRESATIFNKKTAAVELFETPELGVNVYYEEGLLRSYKKYKYKYRLGNEAWGNNQFEIFLEWVSN